MNSKTPIYKENVGVFFLLQQIPHTKKIIIRLIILPIKPIKKIFKLIVFLLQQYIKKKTEKICKELKDFA